MKWQVYFGIALRIVLLFVTAMLVTYAMPGLRPFFGDRPCTSGCVGDIEPNWNWGARHYWYFWMMLLLFLLSLVNLIISIVNLVQKHYPDYKPNKG